MQVRRNAIIIIITKARHVTVNIVTNHLADETIIDTAVGTIDQLWSSLLM